MAKLTEAERIENRILLHERGLKKLQYGTAKNAVAAEFQKLVRLKAANANGMCRCVTCFKFVHWKMCDAGHFIKRRHEGTLFDPKNVAPQCKFCNDYLRGNDANYAAWMEVNYGKAAVKRLRKKSEREMKWTMRQLAIMKIEYLDAQQIELKRLAEH